MRKLTHDELNDISGKKLLLKIGGQEVFVHVLTDWIQERAKTDSTAGTSIHLNTLKIYVTDEVVFLLTDNEANLYQL
jgi:hypothetical protein